MAKKPATKAARLPSGKYAWRGRAVSFSKLPKAERSRFQSRWAGKAAKTRAAPKAPPARERKAPPARERKAPVRESASERKSARAWLDRRTAKIGKGEPSDAILATLGPKAVNALREVQRAAHEAYKGKGKRGRARAGKIAERVRSALGAELAAAMPQLWFYH